MTELISLSEKLSLTIQIELLSDATFGRGDGIAGIVDAEVEHDSYGLPFIRGRTVKGLLNEECANTLFSISQMEAQSQTSTPIYKQYRESALRLFGSPGSDPLSTACLRFGEATLPHEICDAIRFELDVAKAEQKNDVSPEKRRRTSSLQPTDILNSVTAIRRQTALDHMGVPINASLRSMRVVLRQTPYVAELVYSPPGDLSQNELNLDLALLAASIRSLRRGGTGRNRGRGRLKCSLHWQERDVTQSYLDTFTQSIGHKTSDMEAQS